MDNALVIAAMRGIIKQAQDVIINAGGGSGSSGGVVVPPPAPTTAPMGTVDPATNMLTGGKDVNGAHIDPVVATGTPTTVTIGETGHVLSVARPDLGERFMGYCIRISDQAQGNVATVGSLSLMGDTLFDKWGGYKADGSNWPFAADRFYNAKAFMTSEEAAQAAQNAAGWPSALKP